MNQPDLYNPHSESDSLEGIRKLYPNLTDEQLSEAQENLDRYIEVALRICERLSEEKAGYDSTAAHEQKRAE